MTIFLALRLSREHLAGQQLMHDSDKTATPGWFGEIYSQCIWGFATRRTRGQWRLCSSEKLVHHVIETANKACARSPQDPFLLCFLSAFLADEMRRMRNLTHLGSLEDVDKGVAPHEGDFPEHVGLKGIQARQRITGVDQGIRMALGPVISSQYFISPCTPSTA